MLDLGMFNPFKSRTLTGLTALIPLVGMAMKSAQPEVATWVWKLSPKWIKEGRSFESFNNLVLAIQNVVKAAHTFFHEGE